MITRFFRTVVPALALTMGLGLAGCDNNFDIKIGDAEGVPLAKLDRSGPAPHKIVLAGPDDLMVTQGDTLTIDVKGDPEAVEALRFTLDDDTLGVTREKGSWKDKGHATVLVTMPSPNEIVLAGSGKITTASLAPKTEITIAGSGALKAAKVEAKSIELTIAGSGSVEAAGSTDRLEMTIAGSGSANMPQLKAGSAELTVAGSGEATFASDGKVEASIMGSGSVVVLGDASCTVSAMGSGTLTCASKSARTAPDAPGAPAAPEAPRAPEAPEAP